MTRVRGSPMRIRLSHELASRRGSLRVYPCGLSEFVFDNRLQKRTHRRRIAAENAVSEGDPGDEGHLSMDHQISVNVPKRGQDRPNR